MGGFLYVVFTMHNISSNYCVYESNTKRERINIRENHSRNLSIFRADTRGWWTEKGNGCDGEEQEREIFLLHFLLFTPLLISRLIAGSGCIYRHAMHAGGAGGD